MAISANRVSGGRNVSDNGDNYKRKHNHIKEVIHRNNHHRAFPVITGRLDQLVNLR